MEQGYEGDMPSMKAGDGAFSWGKNVGNISITWKKLGEKRKKQWEHLENCEDTDGKKT